MKKIPFYKMQGSGNDFILIDNRGNILKGMNLRGLAVNVCDRHLSVGADGLIVIVPSKNSVKVQLAGAAGLRMNIAIPLDSGLRMGHFINTGVPHVVYLSKDLDNEDIDRIGRTTRYHELFKPLGANVNFI